MFILSEANQKLADLLLSEDILTAFELKQILEQHSLIGGRLADFLIDTAIVPEASLLRLYQRAYDFELLSFSMLEAIDRDVARIIPAQLAQLQMIIPFAQEGLEIHLACLEPPDLNALAQMKGLAGKHIQVFLAPRDLMRWAIAKHYPELFLTPANPNSLLDPFENRIGHRLIAEGLLTKAQLEEALLERTPGKAGRTGELLLRMGYIAEDDLYRSLAAQTKIPFVKIPLEYTISDSVAALFTKADVMRWQSIPVFEDETSITILTSEPNLIAELEPLFDRSLTAMISTPSQIKFLTQQLESEDKPLVRLLLQQDLRLEQRAKALVYAQENNLDLTEALLELGFVSQTNLETMRLAIPSEQVIPLEQPWELSFSGRLAHNLAEQLGVTYVDPADNPPDLSLVGLIPEKTMRQYSLFPYQKTESGLAVLMTDPRNIFALNDLEALLERPIEPVMADRLEIEKLIDSTFSPSTVAFENLEPPPETLEVTIRRYIREELEIFRQQLLLDLRA
jgi:type IV pilus assembly protein PilB